MTIKDKSIGIIPIFYEKNKYWFLIIQQSLRDWIFPKGHPISGETDTQTALRELYEETKINKCTIIDNFKYELNYSFKRQGVIVEKQVIFFLGLVDISNISTIISLENSAGEVLDLKWLSYDDALKQLTHKNQQEMLKQVFKYLKNNTSIQSYNFINNEQK
jgi:DNA polymerase